MDLHLLSEAEMALSKCGRPVLAPPGRSIVSIFKGFLVQGQLPINSRQTFFKTITGEATWSLRAISIFATAIPSTNPVTLYVQIQLPNGRFLENTFQDINQIVGFGSKRFLFSRELDCVPGSKLQVTLDTTIPAASYPQAAIMLFEGAYKYYVSESGHARPSEPAGPRYLGTPNQNIMAPCWMSGEGPETPEGFVDQPFIYESTLGTATLGASQVLGLTVQSQIDNDADFICRRIYLATQAPAGSSVTAGRFLALPRTGSGYSLTSDYVDVGYYLQNAPWAHDWVIAAGDRIFVDLEYVDGAGSGNVTCRAYFEGVKRRKR